MFTTITRRPEHGAVYHDYAGKPRIAYQQEDGTWAVTDPTTGEMQFSNDTTKAVAFAMRYFGYRKIASSLHEYAAQGGQI